MPTRTTSVSRSTDPVFHGGMSQTEYAEAVRKSRNHISILVEVWDRFAKPAWSEFE